MTDPADTRPEICQHIRAKGGGLARDAPVTWQSGYYASAVFWCLTTANPIGPDDGFVHPHECIDGRACYCAPNRRALGP